MFPSSMVGASLLWKKAQKKAKKKHTSEIINRTIPIRNPRDVFLVWNPWKVLSRVTSRHHCTMVMTIIINPKFSRFMDDP